MVQTMIIIDHGENDDDDDYDVNVEQLIENILLLCIFFNKKMGQNVWAKHTKVGQQKNYLLLMVNCVPCPHWTL